ncbi:MAG: lipopolysaccharide biosynthesis protein [Clostridiales bacterium]|nr:lipopolysaccharide biosynthesis protein [Clostridiales bacterium]
MGSETSLSDTSTKQRRGLRKFLLNDKNIERNGYIWNMIGSMMNAFQSVFLLVIINRVLGEGESGIFNIAYANANLFLNMGKYGMRYYQVSDVKHEHSFGDYLTSRIISCAAMIISSLIYVLYSAFSNSYSPYKTWIIIFMCLFKVVDSFEDVYGGQYQNHDRLDVAGKVMSVRTFLLYVVFGVGVVVFKNMLIALIITVATNTLIWIYLTLITYKDVKVSFGKVSKARVKSLMIKCFPLFAGAFLSFYIGNAPKYAIDKVLSDELQSHYGFIAMPVFVVGLLNNFIFNPQIVVMTKLWTEGKVKAFVGRVLRQIGIVFGITFVCIAGAYVLGIPVLSKLYACDLAPYKLELLVLLLGGGFLGLTGLLNATITIIRFQKSVMWGYLSVAILALLFSNKVVSEYGIRGASILYTSLMAILSLVFVVLFVIGIKVGMKKQALEASKSQGA